MQAVGVAAARGFMEQHAKSISLAELRDTLQDYRYALRMLEVWLEAREDEIVPVYQSLRPEQFGGAMPRISLMETEARDRVVVRIAQTFLETIVGASLRGRNFVEMAPPALRETRMHRFEQIGKVPCGALTMNRVKLKTDGGFDLVGLTLPVARDSDGETALTVTCLDWHGDYALHEVPRANFPVSPDATYIDLGCGVPSVDIVP